MGTFGDWSNYFDDLLKDKNDESVFIRFMILWMAFNSYYSRTYQLKWDKAGVDSVGKELKAQKIYNRNKEKILDAFSKIPSNYCNPRIYVKDMRINTPQDAFFDEKYSELSDFLSAVYQVRCNLFHGDKPPNSDIDEKLVSWAYINLLEFLTEYLPDLFSIKYKNT